MTNHYWLYETDSRTPIVSWCNTRAIPCRKLWNIVDLSWCSVFTVSHLSGSQMDHLLIPALNLHTGSALQTVWSPTASILEKQKQEPHGWGNMVAWGMLAATFKSAPVGFYETGNTKATFTIKQSHTKGVSSLASMRRKRSQEKHQHLQ